MTKKVSVAAEGNEGQAAAQIVKLSNSQNVKMSKCQFDKMTKRQNDKMTISHFSLLISPFTLLISHFSFLIALSRCRDETGALEMCGGGGGEEFGGEREGELLLGFEVVGGGVGRDARLEEVHTAEGCVEYRGEAAEGGATQTG